LLGGAKVSDKIEVIDNLIKIADTILIGGAMAYTFLKSDGYEIGKSLVELDKLDLARDLVSKASSKGIEFLVPLDHVVVDKEVWETDEKRSKPHAVSVSDTRPGEIGFDIGPRTIELYKSKIAGAKTIIWNGPMGLFERPPFDHGTTSIALALAASGATTIVGGGDSVAAVVEAGVADKITHISTGGGASLEFLAGKALPGVAALTEKD
jgi:phosphoglycerate kinase